MSDAELRKIERHLNQISWLLVFLNLVVFGIYLTIAWPNK